MTNRNTPVSGTDELGNLKTIIKNSDPNQPIPTNGDSVYSKDVDLDKSDSTDWTGDITDLFGELDAGVINITTDNPKLLTIVFNRTVVTNAVGLGAESGSFSNTKVIALLSGGVEVTVFDGTADSTIKTSDTIQITPLGAIGFRFEFHTTNTITLTNIVILKTITTVSRLEAQKDDGTVTPIGATDSGNLRVTDAESGLAIAKGDVADTTFVHKFGNAPQFATANGTIDVWDGADSADIAEFQYVFSTSAIIDSLSSSDNGDTQQIEIQGLDSSFLLVNQTITLAGQARVALTTSLIRIFRMKNADSVDISGNVYCYENTAITLGIPDDTTKIRARIDNGNNQTEMAIYTVPDAKTGYIRDWYASTAAGNKDSNYIMELFIRPFGQVFQLKHKLSISDTGTSYLQHLFEEPEIADAKSDIIIRTTMTAVGGTGASVSAGFDMVLIDN